METNLSYIGSAVALKQRGHYKLLKSGKSHNFRLQSAFDKYGERAFVFQIIDLCPGQDPVALEQKRIDERDFETLYNLAPIAGSILGYEFTSEQRERLSKTKMDVPITDEGRRANWLKKVEREVKANIYKKLFRGLKKRVAYEELLSEIKAYIKSGPGWAQPVMGKLEEDDSWSNWGSDFETWWVYGGGREHADKKYQISNYSLNWRVKRSWVADGLQGVSFSLASAALRASPIH